MSKGTPSFYLNEPGRVRPDEFDYDVIIVGSGISGLSAAYNIMKKKSGITTLVLEGSDKIGGRLGISGATRGFFIDDRQEHINKLISDLGLTVEYRRQIENENRVYYSRNGRVIQRENMFEEIDNFINRLDLTSEIIELKTYADYPQAKKLASMSFETLIRNCITNSEAREFMKTIAYTICGVEPTFVSALWFILMTIGAGGLKRRIKFALGNNRRQFVPDGAGKILEKLLDAVDAGRIEIQTKSVVDLIEFNDVYAYVSINDGEQYKCEYVIIAVPPPENSKIRILPTDEDVLRNQISHKSGNGTFFVATYEEAWWLRNNYSGEIIGSSDNPSVLRLVYEATCDSESPTPLSPYILSGFLKRSIKKSSSHPLESLRNSLTGKLKWDENTSHQTEYSTTCKSYEEWEWPGENETTTRITEGGYPMSVMKPCSVKNHVNPMLKPHKRVYWACSEYARFWPGTLDGAVESGEYVSRSILFNLRPQSLDSQELRFITPDTVVGKNHLPLDLVALHFFVTGIVTAILILYCKPVKPT